MLIKPLNPPLFRALQRVDSSVSIIRPGELNVWSRFRVPVALGINERYVDYRYIIECRGEEYKLCCPRCGDQRSRLYVNYAWGVWSEEQESDNLWLINCFNDQCHLDPGWPKHFYDNVVFGLAKLERDPVLPLKEVDSWKPVEVEPPGYLIPLSELKADHPAIVYLKQRRFDISYLNDVFRLSYCPSSKFPFARERIIIPIYLEGVFVGWQARFIGKPPQGVPPYFTMPGLPKGRVGYNFDNAIKYKTMVIVEGATDVWRVGERGLGLLGSSLSMPLAKRVVRSSSGKRSRRIIVVMLDWDKTHREAVKTVTSGRLSLDELRSLAKASNQTPAEKIRDALIRYGLSQVFIAQLPKNKDPDDLSEERLWKIIESSAKKEGFRIKSGRW